MSFRSIVLVTHRWIGLASSLVLIVLGATGAILVIPGRFWLRRIAGPVHEHLAIGKAGWWIVVLATITAVLLELGGAVLWWQRKRVRIRLGGGASRTLLDLHHSSGAVLFLLMLLLAATGIGMAFVTPEQAPELRRIIFNLHTTRGFPLWTRVIYFVGSLGFAVQGVTGVLTWWRPGPSAPPGPASSRAEAPPRSGARWPSASA